MDMRGQPTEKEVAVSTRKDTMAHELSNKQWREKCGFKNTYKTEAVVRRKQHWGLVTDGWRDASEDQGQVLGACA